MRYLFCFSLATILLARVAPAQEPELAPGEYIVSEWIVWDDAWLGEGASSQVVDPSNVKDDEDADDQPVVEAESSSSAGTLPPPKQKPASADDADLAEQLEDALEELLALHQRDMPYEEHVEALKRQRERIVDLSEQRTLLIRSRLDATDDAPAAPDGSQPSADTCDCEDCDCNPCGEDCTCDSCDCGDDEDQVCTGKPGCDCSRCSSNPSCDCKTCDCETCADGNCKCQDCDCGNSTCEPCDKVATVCKTEGKGGHEAGDASTCDCKECDGACNCENCQCKSVQCSGEEGCECSQCSAPDAKACECEACEGDCKCEECDCHEGSQEAETADTSADRLQEIAERLEQLDKRLQELDDN